MPGSKSSGRRSLASLCWTPPHRRRSDTRPPTYYELRELLRKVYVFAEKCPPEFWLEMQPFWVEMRQLVERQIDQTPWPKKLIDQYRWARVRMCLTDGGKFNDDSTYEAAAAECVGTPAAGGPAAMRASYMKVTKHQPDFVRMFSSLE